MRVSAGLAPLAALALTGCGAAGESAYAGMDRDSAHAHAMAGLMNDARRPGSGLYRHRIVFASVSKSHFPSGDDAWRVLATDLTARQNICVWVSSHALGGETYAKPCGPVRSPAPPAPASTASPPS
jgi:hypothetical protein